MIKQIKLPNSMLGENKNGMYVILLPQSIYKFKGYSLLVDEKLIQKERCGRFLMTVAEKGSYQLFQNSTLKNKYPKSVKMPEAEFLKLMKQEIGMVDYENHETPLFIAEYNEYNGEGKVDRYLGAGLVFGNYFGPIEELRVKLETDETTPPQWSSTNSMMKKIGSKSFKMVGCGYYKWVKIYFSALNRYEGEKEKAWKFSLKFNNFTKGLKEFQDLAGYSDCILALNKMKKDSEKTVKELKKIIEESEREFKDKLKKNELSKK